MSAAGIGLADGFSYVELSCTIEINTGRLLAYSAFLCQGFLGDLYYGIVGKREKLAHTDG
jgi:hypothetical protein